MIRLSKYQALGNDYLVVDPSETDAGPAEGGLPSVVGPPLPDGTVRGKLPLTPERIRAVCDRHYGVGSDGILVGPLATTEADFGLRLFNPDGGEFEKSGNGLRIFARYLWDRGLVGVEPFTIHTPGGVVTARVHPGGRRVTVEMGRISFDSRAIPVAGPPREVLDEGMVVGGVPVRYSAATIGNPHCVLVRDQVSADEARRLGPLIEREARFRNRTNVQFMTVVDHRTVRIEIWERGAGYTLASGSSSCAAAAVAHRLGLAAAEVAVYMPGGQIDVAIAPDWSVTMSGAVTRVWAGALYDELFESQSAERCEIQ